MFTVLTVSLSSIIVLSTLLALSSFFTLGGRASF